MPVAIIVFAWSWMIPGLSLSLFPRRFYTNILLALFGALGLFNFLGLSADRHVGIYFGLLTLGFVFGFWLILLLIAFFLTRQSKALASKRTSLSLGVSCITTGIMIISSFMIQKSNGMSNAQSPVMVAWKIFFFYLLMPFLLQYFLVSIFSKYHSIPESTAPEPMSGYQDLRQKQRHSQNAGKQMFMVLGILLVAAPFLYFIWPAFRSPILALRSEHGYSAFKLSNYHESPIVFKGFDGPVGVQVEFDLQGPSSMSGASLGVAYLLSEGEANVICKKYNNPTMQDFQTIRKGQIDGMVSYTGFCGLVSKGIEHMQFPQHVTFTFLPAPGYAMARGIVPQSSVSPDRICNVPSDLSSDSFIGKTWIFSRGFKESPTPEPGRRGKSFDYFDISGLLQEQIEKSDGLLNKPGEIEKMYSRLQPASVLRLGYQSCSPDQSGTPCYCLNSR